MTKTDLRLHVIPVGITVGIGLLIHGRLMESKIGHATKSM